MAKTVKIAFCNPKEFETSIPFISVEKNGKIIGLYFEKECPTLYKLYRKYGTKNVTVRELKIKRVY